MLEKEEGLGEESDGMRAVNGIFENGRFTPTESVRLPQRMPALLVFNSAPVADEGREERLAWLEKFFEEVDRSSDEEMPDFPRTQLGRELVVFSDEDEL